MEFLETKTFRSADELVDFVNDTKVKVLSVTEDLRIFTLFYKKRLD
jgi:hypothetical protein